MGFKRDRSKGRSGGEKLAMYIEYLEKGAEEAYNNHFEEFRTPAHFLDYINRGCRMCYLNSFHERTNKLNVGGLRIKDEKVVKESRGSKLYPFICSEEELFELTDVSNRYSYEEVKKEGVFYKRTYTDLELVVIEQQKKDHPVG
tara:strand:- start:174 stop:605 length:432 start_codon:yes stop_codon:yes gene_type:complete